MRLFKPYFIFVLMVLSGCSSEDASEQTRSIDFTWESGDEGWSVGYADYPADLSLDDSLGLYAMTYGHRTLPAEIVPVQKGMLLAGANRSDDLFMYLTKSIDGLTPSARYTVDIEIVLASNAPTNAVGVGGAPGEAVTLKAGVVSQQPRLFIDQIGWYRLDLDKGNQSIGGADLVVIGNAGVSDNTRQYELITRTTNTPLTAKTDAAGKLWLIAGSDSGFEGFTALYYAQMKVNLKRTTD